MITLMFVTFLVFSGIAVVFAAAIAAVAVFLGGIAGALPAKMPEGLEDVELPTKEERKRLSDAFGKAMTYNDFVDDEDYKHALIAKAFYDVNQ